MAKFDANFSFPSTDGSNNIDKTNDEILVDANTKSVCQQEDNIIKDQSSQMFAMIDIIEAYRKDKIESRESCDVQKNTANIQINKLKRQINVVIMIFFLIMLIVVIYLYRETLVGDK